MSEARKSPDEPPKKDGWDKFQIIGGFIGAVLIPVVLATFGFLLNRSFQEGETKAKNVQLAIEILRESPPATSDETSRKLRQWAVQKIGLPEETEKSLIETQSLPGETGTCCVTCDGTKTCGAFVNTHCGSCGMGPRSTPAPVDRTPKQ